MFRHRIPKLVSLETWLDIATCGSLVFGRFPKDGAPESLEEFLGAGFAILEAACTIPGKAHPIDDPVEANWKLLFQITLDDYHIVAVHRDTFGKQGYLDNEVVRYYRFGWHSAYFYATGDNALAEMAEPLGSDVPFFLFQSAAVCKGHGEMVMPVKLQRPFPVLLLKPGFAVSTAWAYSRWQDSREIPGIRYEAQKFAGQTFANDLERPVFAKFVFLAQLKMWLLSQSEVGAALMSGSGSTMFAVMREDADADSVAKRAKTALDPELWTCACKTL